MLESTSLNNFIDSGTRSQGTLLKILNKNSEITGHEKDTEKTAIRTETDPQTYCVYNTGFTRGSLC